MDDLDTLTLSNPVAKYCVTLPFGGLISSGSDTKKMHANNHVVLGYLDFKDAVSNILPPTRTIKNW